jgi:hypothetical protein
MMAGRSPTDAGSNTQADEANQGAGDRTSNTHPEFSLGIGGFLFNFGDTAKGE